MCVALPAFLGVPLGAVLTDSLTAMRKRDDACALGLGVALTLAPNVSTSTVVSSGTRSSMRTLGCVTSARWELTPTRPPTNTSTPGTIAGSWPGKFFTWQPIMPMSATCTWPQEFGQPVHIMRMSRGRSSTLSSSSATRHAVCFVSIWEKPQNWLPVHATRPAMSLPGNAVYFWSSGSASSAAVLSLGTLGMMKFCSTVSRSSEEPYLSARSAICTMSSASSRPPGTLTPTHDRPGCFCGCTPK